MRYYRQLPWFRGKLRIGKFLFKGQINKSKPVSFFAHHHIEYQIPNTIESLGIELLINGLYERKLTRLLSDRLRDGDLYIDIGANVGATGLPVLKKTRGVKYIGFEASAVVFDYLACNFKNNKVANYSLYNILVHEKDGEVMKFYDGEYYGKGSLAPTYTHDHVLVSSLSLDSFCRTNQIARIDWIKIDVQGFELHVFKGMRQLLLDKKVNNILFEFEYWAEEDAGLEKGTAQKYVLKMGYELFDMTGKKIPALITEGRAMIWARPVNSPQ